MTGEEKPALSGRHPVKKPYKKALLTIHGDLKEMTGRPS
jgi:hypothetical protein